MQSLIIVLTVLLILISAIITIAEVALDNITKGKLRNMVEDGVKNAQALLDLTESEFLKETLTIGNSFVNVSSTVLGSYLLGLNLHLKSFVLELVIAIFIMTFIVLIMGEIIPETVARKKPEVMALRYVGLIKFFMILLRPMIVIFYGFSSLILRILGVKKEKEPTVTMEEFKSIVDASVEEGVLDIQEKELIDNVTEFRELRVGDVMTQRTDMVTLSSNSTYDEVKSLILEEKYSRIPVYRETIDDIVGILNIKDLIFTDYKEDFNVCEYVREPYFTYEFKLVQELFREMRKERSHMAIVLDEYGGTVGLVTIEDFLEELVGDIDDEFDEIEDAGMKKLGENQYYFAGTFKLADLNEELGTKIHSEEVDTIGGFIIDLLGSFPEDNQEIEYENLKFIVDFSKNRITGVKVIVNDNLNEI